MGVLFRKLFILTITIFLSGIDFSAEVLAKTKSSRTEKSSEKKVQKKRKSKKSKKGRGGRYRGKRFKYKRGGPDIRVLTKESPYSEVPDNGVTSVDEAPKELPRELKE